MTSPLLLSIDQGTTSSRAMLFSKNGDVVAVRQKELRLHCPHPGWVEQDPEDIWADTLEVCRGVLDGAGTIAALGITNQRETTILWDKKTGVPVYNAIVWQDRRTADICARLRDAGHEPDVRNKTGLLLDPYFSATKIAWILEHVEGVRARAEAGDIAFGTVDTFLLWRLTGGAVHATDSTNASRTLLFNIRTQDWDERLLRLFGIPKEILPDVRDTCADYGVTRADLLGRAIPVTAMAGDQQAALAGQGCFTPGMVKSTYGTGCFALMTIGRSFRLSSNRLLTTPAIRLNGETHYALEGSIFTAGAAVQWLRDGLRLIREAGESEALALSVPNNAGVYFVPAFTGLGAPYWDPNARGIISGLTRDSTGAHIARAALEAQGYQTRDLMDAFAADGGLVSNAFVCQFIADMIGIPLEIPAVAETTALGAAYLAGLHAGIYADTDALAKGWRAARRYEPKMDHATRNSLYAGWKDSVARALSPQIVR